MEGKRTQNEQKKRNIESTGADGPTERKHEATATMLVLHQ